MAWLAPDIIEAILDGRQPPSLTATSLMRDTRLPTDWQEQRRVLGFVSARPHQLTVSISARSFP